MKLLIATQNKGKLAEFESLLSGLGYEILSPADFSGLDDFDVPETGQTFAKNAFLKAQAFAHKAQVLTLADDSGLEIEVYDGFPGVMSDRWCGGTAEEKNVALLEKMKGEENRGARFVSTLCLYDPQTKKSEYFEGEVRGVISEESRGLDGFGYDPVFVPEGYTETFAELGLEEKNKLSHRKRALEKLQKFLRTKL